MKLLRTLPFYLLVSPILALGQGFYSPVRNDVTPGLSIDSLRAFDAFHTAMDPSQLTHSEQHSHFPFFNGIAVFPSEFRSIDGSGNNETDLLRGAANIPLVRISPNGYADGVGSPGGVGEKGARDISNLVIAQTDSILNTKRASDYLWQWGQFLDHDMTLTPVAAPAEAFNIPVPQGDPVFDPTGTGTKILAFKRSLFALVNNVRQQINVDTAYIDGSQVYGSDEARAHELRMLDGSGRLKSSANNLLPFNLNGFPNQPDTTSTFFLAGDIRANETSGLTVLQTLFMREHNFWADTIKNADPTLDDDGIYFRARAMVGAEIQVITYRDFIPLLLGSGALSPYTGYNPEVDAGVSNEFATAGFRLGHTLLSPQLLRLDASGQSIGDLTLHGTHFSPTTITGPGIEPYLRGLGRQAAQQLDVSVIDAMRNFLFGSGTNGFDLPSLNIQRGRDHGLPRYNQVRAAYGLKEVRSFSRVTADTAVQAKLASAYATPDNMDVWVGALAEKHKTGAMVGETLFAILKDQFERTRDGDRFWYQSYFDPSTVQSLESTTLADIIRRNSPITTEIQANVFRVPKAPLPTPTPTPTP